MVRSDIAIFELFVNHPDLIKTFITTRPDVHYTMRAEEIKEVTKRLDAVFIPDDPSLPLIHMEFQGYSDPKIYYRAVAGGCMLGYLDRTINVCIMFFDKEQDPKTPPLYEWAMSPLIGLSVIYLPDIVEQLRLVKNPAAGLLGLLTIKKKEIAATAPQDYQLIVRSSLPRRIRENYVKLFMYWLMQLLGDEMDDQEVRDMLGILMPIEDTKAYKRIAKVVGVKYEQQLHEKDEALHKKDEALHKNLEHQILKEKANIDRFKLLKDEGQISKELFVSITLPMKQELASLRKQLRAQKKGKTPLS